MNPFTVSLTGKYDKLHGVETQASRQMIRQIALAAVHPREAQRESISGYRFAAAHKTL